MFQSTHPRGVRRLSTGSSRRSIGFNPRTHEGCDIIGRKRRKFFSVSIHAPTRGATRQNCVRGSVTLFQSTHPRGVRLLSVRSYVENVVFQSTHPRGVRLPVVIVFSACKSFNPRTHEGCDRWQGKSVKTIKRFNPRTHEGCDVFTLTLLVFLISFNPRTHEGCDET